MRYIYVVLVGVFCALSAGFGSFLKAHPAELSLLTDEAFDGVYGANMRPAVPDNVHDFTHVMWARPDALADNVKRDLIREDLRRHILHGINDSSFAIRAGYGDINQLIQDQSLLANWQMYKDLEDRSTYLDAWTVNLAGEDVADEVRASNEALRNEAEDASLGFYDTLFQYLAHAEPEPEDAPQNAGQLLPYDLWVQEYIAE